MTSARRPLAPVPCEDCGHHHIGWDRCRRCQCDSPVQYVTPQCTGPSRDGRQILAPGGADVRSANLGDLLGPKRAAAILSLMEETWGPFPEGTR